MTCRVRKIRCIEQEDARPTDARGECDVGEHIAGPTWSMLLEANGAGQENGEEGLSVLQKARVIYDTLANWRDQIFRLSANGKLDEVIIQKLVDSLGDQLGQLAWLVTRSPATDVAEIRGKSAILQDWLHDTDVLVEALAQSLCRDIDRMLPIDREASDKVRRA